MQLLSLEYPLHLVGNSGVWVIPKSKILGVKRLADRLGLLTQDPGQRH